MALHLLWIDRESVPRMRHQPPWRPLVEALAAKPFELEADDPPIASKEPVDAQEAREVFEILAHATPTDAAGVHESLAAAVRDDGLFVPPLRLLSGELIFPFDEIESLKALLAAVTPFAGPDEPLRAAMASALELLKIPDLRGAPAVADALSARIRDAWAQSRRALPHGYLEAQTERALLEGRCYQRRKLLGGKHLRALLQPAGAQELLPAYLPDALADDLPLFQRFRARLIAEVHQQIDQHESHPAALRVLALLRAAPLAAPR